VTCSRQKYESRAGCLVFTVYHGAKPAEFERGKADIAVRSVAKLPALIDALIGAAQAGEIDDLLSRQAKPMGAAKFRSAA